MHAASIEISARDQVKTDKRDSLKIATQLQAGRLKCIDIPSVERESFRFITRLREKLVKDRTRLGVQLKSFLNLNGLLSYKDTKKVCLKWIQNFVKPVNDSEINFYLKVLAKRWLEVDVVIKEINSRLILQAGQEEELQRIYQSVPGIGPIASRILINELGDMSQFKNEKGLFSFTGLTPQEYSSGENTRQGHISRQGRAVLRKTLVQVAWRAINSHEGLKKVFDRISVKAGRKRAIVAIARRLIGQTRACLQKKEE